MFSNKTESVLSIAPPTSVMFFFVLSQCNPCRAKKSSSNLAMFEKDQILAANFVKSVCFQLKCTRALTPQLPEPWSGWTHPTPTTPTLFVWLAFIFWCSLIFSNCFLCIKLCFFDALFHPSMFLLLMWRLATVNNRLKFVIKTSVLNLFCSSERK